MTVDLSTLAVGDMIVIRGGESHAVVAVLLEESNCYTEPTFYHIVTNGIRPTHWRDVRLDTTSHMQNGNLSQMSIESSGDIVQIIKQGV